MNMMKLTSACAVVVMLSVSASAGLSNFIVTDADGAVYEVDGQTLDTTFITNLNSSHNINEIMYIGNNQLLANITGQIVQYDLVTDQREIVFNARDYLGDVGFHYTTGLAQTRSGEVFFSVQSHGPDGSEDFGATYDFDSQTFHRLADIDRPTGLYFDHHKIGDDLFVGANFSSEQITVFNSVTGLTEATYDVGYGVVSFFEQGDELFAMSKEGELYSFDASTGSSVLVGQITGAGNSLIGATIPAPSSFAFLGFAGLVATRRRR